MENLDSAILACVDGDEWFPVVKFNDPRKKKVRSESVVLYTPEGEVKTHSLTQIQFTRPSKRGTHYVSDTGNRETMIVYLDAEIFGVYYFIDVRGNVLIWYAADNAKVKDQLEDGHWYEIRATVTKHMDINLVFESPRTVISRVMIGHDFGQAIEFH